MKQEEIYTKIESSLKQEVESVLSKLGISHEEMITRLYQVVSTEGQIPEVLKLRIPNEETRKALEDTDYISYESKEKMFESWLDDSED